MAPATQILEQELREAQTRVRTLESEASRDHEAAEELVASYRSRGVNPLTDATAFEEVDQAYKVGDAKREEVAQIRTRMESLMEKLGKSSSVSIVNGGGRVAPSGLAGMATRVHESEAFTAFTNGDRLLSVEVLDREATAAYFANTADVTGAPVRDRQDFLVPIPVRPTRILDLISVGTTDGDTITYIEETTRTDAAAETALGTAYSEGSYVYTERTSPVRDIGHFTPAHRSNLMDWGVLQSLLQGRLLNGVERRIEQQVVSGDNTGSNLKGILNTAGIGSKAKTAGEPRIETLHRCITGIRLSFFDEPDAILLHPTDYESVVFEKDADGDYLLGGPASRESPTVWGKPIVPSAVITQGTGLVGAWKQGAQLWLRSGVSIRSSDSHSTFFTERRVALLAEARAAFAAWQPKAFSQATGL
jgi:HK97 family phage major capsid protein